MQFVLLLGLLSFVFVGDLCLILMQEAALCVLSTHSIEEAIRIFTEVINELLLNFID